MPGLQHIEDDGERCRLCGRLAAGPCASCHRPVCGDCCVLSEGGVKVWAICLDCERDGGRSMRRRWLGLAAWLGLILLVLGGLVAVLALASGRT